MDRHEQQRLLLFSDSHLLCWLGDCDDGVMEWDMMRERRGEEGGGVRME